MNIKQLLCALTLPLTLLACGGGSGNSGTVTSTETFQVWDAWVNYASTSATRAFTFSGTAYGTSVTGAGTTTNGSLTASTFESAPAQRRTTVISGTIEANGNSIPYSATTNAYFDSNYLPLGYSATDEYGVIVGAVNIPRTAKVNDTAVVYTFDRYTSSSKFSRLGTSEVSIALLPDTATTALLKVINTKRSSGGSLESTTTQTFRMTPAGALTAISEQFVEGANALTLKY